MKKHSLTSGTSDWTDNLLTQPPFIGQAFLHLFLLFLG